MEKKELAQALESVQCSKINFENLERIAPAIKLHPTYKIAKMQLDEAVEKLEKEVYGKEVAPEKDPNQMELPGVHHFNGA